jgi:hypothetical protein
MVSRDIVFIAAQVNAAGRVGQAISGRPREGGDPARSDCTQVLDYPPSQMMTAEGVAALFRPHGEERHKRVSNHDAGSILRDAALRGHDILDDGRTLQL